MVETPRISIVIVNYNAGPLLSQCLAALMAQSMPDFEAIIVENNSTDGSLETAMRLGDNRFHVLRLGANVGFAAGNNRGIELAQAPWIATLNPDAFPAPDWLSSFLQAVARYPDVHFFGSTQISAEDESLLDGCGDCYHVLGIPWRGGFGHPRSAADSEGEVFGPCAAAAFYRAETLRALGGFDEAFFCYCEDVDLAFRFRLLGHRCLQLADAHVYHVGSAVTGQRSPFTLCYSVRNRMWVVFKNMPWPLLMFLFPAHLLAVAYLLFRSIQTDSIGPQWRGFKAGVAGLSTLWGSRRRVQAARRATSWQIFASFTWSLGKLRRRDPDVRPWRHGRRQNNRVASCSKRV